MPSFAAKKQADPAEKVTPAALARGLGLTKAVAEGEPGVGTQALPPSSMQASKK
ncbi:hypothetical protein [Rhizobium sp. LjRoot258]|uniref:hypothetical protein n=1 Tax=Rhizobium sp. LjRoot258 TaxID=3342299 RepID=UPI003ECF6561